MLAEIISMEEAKDLVSHGAYFQNSHITGEKDFYLIIGNTPYFRKKIGNECYQRIIK